MRHSSVARALAVACAALAVSALVATALSGQSARTGAADRSNEQSFDDLYRRVHHTSAGITTLSARFTESTASTLLAVPLVAHGTLAVQRPSRVTLQYGAPERRAIVIDGDTMTSAWPSRNLRQVVDIGRTQRAIQQYLTSDSTAELRRQFEIDLRRDTERRGCFEVVLTPKRPKVRKTWTFLTLWVDRSSFLLSAIRITFANGDIKTMEFRDIELNPSLDERAFRPEQ